MPRVAQLQKASSPQPSPPQEEREKIAWPAAFNIMENVLAKRKRDN